MSSYEIRSRINITPVEITTLANGSSKLLSIDSSIGKMLGSDSKIESLNATDILYKASYEIPEQQIKTLDDVNILNANVNLKKLFVRIIGKGANSNAPAVNITINNDGYNHIEGVGDFTYIGFNPFTNGPLTSAINIACNAQEGATVEILGIK